VNEDTLEQLRDAASAAFADTPVRFAYLFGSSVRAEDDTTGMAPRDLDIAVHCGGEPYDLLGLLGRLDPIEACVRRPVDLVVLDDAPLRLVVRVLRDRVLLYSRDEVARVLYEDVQGRVALDHALVTEPLDRALLAARGSRG
jgi:uncharacterized protein